MAIFTRFRFLALVWLLGGGWLSSCTVYSPMQPIISTVNKAGQVEATAGLQLNGRMEGTAVYAPLPHVLLAAAGTYRPGLGSESYFSTRQWEAGMGSYYSLSERWQLAGLLGYGRAVTERADYYLFIDKTPSIANARYQKLFGQLGLNYIHSRYAFGCVYRFTQLRFDYLYEEKINSVEIVDLKQSSRNELLGYARCGFRFLPAQWQWQFSAGLSLPSSLREPSHAEDPTGAIDRLNRPVFLLGTGLVFGSKR